MSPDLNEEQYCYLTTTGRVSGKPHTIEIWFAREGTTLYMLSGGGDRSDWVRNIRREPAVSVRIAGRDFEGIGRIVEPGGADDGLARRLLFEKYSGSYSGDLTNWRDTALPVAVELGTIGDSELISR
jgi:deazaflavin-dependent oxidoreductase (nitroreductase family)